MNEILGVIEKAETGSVCKETDFDTKVIGLRAREIVREFDIRYDPENLVPDDNSLADDVFKAGFRLALETGFFCRETSRIIGFTESELKEAFNSMSGLLSLGCAGDEVIMKHRTVESSTKPIIAGGGCGQPVSEDLYVPAMASMVRYPIVDIFAGSLTLHEVYGKAVRSGSPTEVLLVKREMELSRQALEMVKRPGMHQQVGGGPTALSSLAACSTEGGVRKTDGHLIGVLPEMKTDFIRLSIALHLEGYGGIPISLICPMIGYAGGPEVAAVIGVASTLLSAITYGAKYFMIGPMDIAYPSCITTRRAIWMENVLGQALSRNTRSLIMNDLIASAGLCTEMLFHEIAAVTIGSIPSGWSIGGVGAGSTKRTNGSGGLEGNFMGECAIASMSLKRRDADSMVLELLRKYEDHLKNPPIGLLFPDCYDAKTGQPLQNVEVQYKRAKNELEEMGLKFQ
jgi:methylamine--corrinoid protein Co-methyltransferase